jgi:membrane protein DedA with SNARE-associated domain/rhodanese-related sulfurtransferase
MPVAIEFFLQYGYLILFFWVLLEQLGLPLPSTPLMVTAGTLTATHKLSLPMVIAATVLACLISDSIWYQFGRRFGGAVVRMMCRLSFESATCVRRTENYFERHGSKALLVAKFVPGLGTVAAPIAGQTGMAYRQFLSFDAAGALLWSSALTLGGRFFGDILKRNPDALSWVGHFAGAIFILALLGFVAQRIYRQQSFLKQVRTSRLEPQELKAMIDSGQKVFIVDLRHPLDFLVDPRVPPGAHHYTPEELLQHNAEIPRDQDVVLYCTCPSEATAAKTALSLRRMGIYRVRPLKGGFDTWKRLGYPLVTIDEPSVTMEKSAPLGSSAQVLES